MALFFDTFAVTRAQDSLQIIQYSGPPKPKQNSHRHLSKASPRNDSPNSNTKMDNKENLITTSDTVEVIDLTRLAGEHNSKISGDEGRGDDDVSSHDDFAPNDGSEGEEFKRTSLEGTGDESSNQTAPSKKIRRNAVVIKDSQLNLDTDSDDSYKNDAGTQESGRLESSSVSILDWSGRMCATVTEDVTSSNAFDGVKPQLSEPENRQFSPKSPIGSSKMDFEQSKQGTIPTIKDTSSSSSSNNSDTDYEDNDDHSNQTVRLACKRKRFPSTERHIWPSNTTSKQHFKRHEYSAKHQKLSPSSGNSFSNRPSALKLVSAPLGSGINAKDCYSDSSSDGSSDNHVRHLESNKRPMSTIHISRAREHDRKRSRDDTADEDDEYEVERILNARISRKKLQYRVKWLDYKDDPKWYNACNFKNSPHKLRDFHLINPTSSGPPKQLERWIQCWEKDCDTDDHPDNNKAQD